MNIIGSDDPRRKGYLPTELLMSIFDIIKEEEEEEEEGNAQKTFRSCALVNSQWWVAATPYLYETPQHIEENVVAFANAVSGKISDQGHSAAPESSETASSSTSSPPSTTLLLTKRGRRGVHVKKTPKKTPRPAQKPIPLGQFVRVLDMSNFTYHSTNSMTARIVSSTRERLEKLVAPAYSFSIATLPALSHCTKLRVLNLSQVMVPKKLTFSGIKKSIKNMQDLEVLRLPMRKLPIDDMLLDTPWPPKIQDLHFGGIFSPHALHTVNWPPAVRNLVLNLCESSGSTQIDLAILLRGAQPPDPNSTPNSVLLAQKLPKLEALFLESWAGSIDPYVTGTIIRQLDRRMRVVSLPGGVMRPRFFAGFEGTAQRMGDPILIDRMQITLPAECEQRPYITQQLTLAANSIMSGVANFVLQSDIYGSQEWFCFTLIK